MKLNVFAIWDDKSGAFSNPFFAVTRGQAIRNFGDVCLDPGSSISKHREDYKLYSLGVFDDESGKFTCSDIPELISSGIDFDGEIRRVK